MAEAGWWICRGLLHYSAFFYVRLKIPPNKVWGLSWWSTGYVSMRLPRWLSGQESACQCKEMQKMQFWSLGRGIPPGGGNINPLQYSCLKNAVGRKAWRATICRVTKSQTWPSDCARTPNAGGMSSIPSWGTKNPLTTLRGQKKPVLNIIQIRNLN